MKYYYDTPIEAEYMVKEFGIRLINSEGKKVIGVNTTAAHLPMVTLSFFCDEGLKYMERAFVAPGDNGFFEPRERDICAYETWVGESCVVVYEPYEKESYDNCGISIKLRDGKPFFTPDSQI